MMIHWNGPGTISSLPHLVAMDAQRAFVAIALGYGDVDQRLRETVPVDLLTDPNLRAILRAVRRFRDEYPIDTALDFAVLKSFISEAGEHVDDEFLTKLIQEDLTYSNPELADIHAEQIAKAAQHRRTIEATTSAAQKLRAGEDAGAVLEVLTDHLADIKTGPEKPRRQRATRQPYPINALPEPIQSLAMAGAQSLQTDPSMIAGPALALLGIAAGNLYRLELKAGWQVPPIINVAIVSPSGTSKSSCVDLAVNPFREWDVEQQEYFQRETWPEHRKAMAWHKRKMTEWTSSTKSSGGDPPDPPEVPICPRVLAQDATMEALVSILAGNPRGLAVCWDELSGLFGGMDQYRGGKGSDAAHWLNAYGARPVTVDRKTGDPRTITVKRPAVAIVGGIQPQVLRKVVGPDHRDNGFLSRFLLTNPPRQMKAWTDEGVPREVESAYRSTVRALLSLPVPEEPEILRLTKQARDVFRGWFNEVNAMMLEASGDYLAALSKLEETAARLAMIVHIVRAAAGDSKLLDQSRVDADSMRAGVELARWYAAEARLVYGLFSESESDRDERRLIEWLERQPGRRATARKAAQNLSWIESSDDALKRLSALAKAGFGEWVEVESEPGKPGPKSRALQLFDSAEEIP
jgi:hypothetical protein